jgi:hypothetical protein
MKECNIQKMVSLKSRSSHMANNEGTTPVYVVLFSHQKKSLNSELNYSQISFQDGVRVFVIILVCEFMVINKKKKGRRGPPLS